MRLRCRRRQSPRGVGGALRLVQAPQQHEGVTAHEVVLGHAVQRGRHGSRVEPGQRLGRAAGQRLGLGETELDGWLGRRLLGELLERPARILRRSGVQVRDAEEEPGLDVAGHLRDDGGEHRHSVGRAARLDVVEGQRVHEHRVAGARRDHLERRDGLVHASQPCLRHRHPDEDPRIVGAQPLGLLVQTRGLGVVLPIEGDGAESGQAPRIGRIPRARSLERGHRLVDPPSWSRAWARVSSSSAG